MNALCAFQDSGFKIQVYEKNIDCWWSKWNWAFDGSCLGGENRDGKSVYRR